MKKVLSYFSSHFGKVLSFLRVRASAAGLEVSDEVVRLTRFDGKVWQMHAIRLEPGTVEKGRVKGREALIAALTTLKANMGERGKGKKVNVVLCPSSVEAYTQVFTLPTVQGESLEKAVELNLQMASPLEATESYSGWQLVGRDEGTLQLEILSVFVGRKIVDDMVDALFDAGFLVMAMDSKALALTRVLREKGAGVDVMRSSLFVSIDNSGIDFLIMRNGSLYFEYRNSWRDLVDEKGEISVAKFEAAFRASLRQVVNFYNQHWKEPLGAIVLAASALQEQAERVIAANAPLPATRLTLVMGQPISSEWLVALGSSLRGTGLAAKDREVNLLGGSSRDRFHEEQLLHFLRFWRALVPTALAILVLTFAVADFFLKNTKDEIESRSDFHLAGSQAAEIANLEDAAKEFNRSVAIIAAAENMQRPKYSVFEAVFSLAATHRIRITRLPFPGFGATISVSGNGTSQDDVIAFKNALVADPHFSAATLPLTGIQTSGNTVSFTMSVVLSAAPEAP